MKIVITGSCGFLGSELAHYLYNKKHELVLIDNLNNGYRNNLIFSDVDLNQFFIKGDIRNDLTKWLAGAEVLFNMAAISSLPVCQSQAFAAYNNNVAGYLSILEQARQTKIPHIIQASTSAIYENNKTYPFEELDETYPSLLYSLGKKHCEELGLSFTHNYGMNITNLRFFNCYGGRMDMQRQSPPLIAYLIKCFIKNETPILHSDGEQQRDYVYCSDVIRACELAIINDGAVNQTFNIASNTTISVRQIVEKVAKYFPHHHIQPTYRDPSLLWDQYLTLQTGYQLNPEIVSAETTKHSIGSYDKAKRLLGWEPHVSIEQGIAATVYFAQKQNI